MPRPAAGRRAPPPAKRRPRSPLVLAGAAALAVAAAVGVAVLLLRGRGPERPRFDGAAALALVEKQVTFGPRVPNSEGHAQLLRFLQEHLKPRADSLAVEEFQHVVLQGDTLRMANVIASFRPQAASRVMLATHWDTRPVAEKDADAARRTQPIPGANDGGSGTAVLLALADVLADNPLPEGYGVDLVFLDGEDYGHDPQTLAPLESDMYLGAREFARAHAGYRPLFGVLLDMVGDRDADFQQEGHSLDAVPEIVRRVWAAADELGYGDVFRRQLLGYITDDHVFLNQAGIRTMDLIDFDYAYWHTHEDTPANVSAKTLGMVGDVLIELLYKRL
jgi:hypothetical protein